MECFALEHKQWKDVHFELSARADQQEIDVDDNSKQDFDGSAFSYAGAANWEFAPNYKLSFVASHQSVYLLHKSYMQMVPILRPILMS